MRKPQNESNLKRNLREFWLLNPLRIYKTVNGHLLTRDATMILMCCLYDIDDMTYYDCELQTSFIDAYLGEKMTKVEIFNALTYLERLELIENFCGTKDNYTFSLTHEGIYFFELRRKNFFYLFTNSVLLPVVISLITTLITLAISVLLQQL